VERKVRNKTNLVLEPDILNIVRLLCIHHMRYLDLELHLELWLGLRERHDRQMLLWRAVAVARLSSVERGDAAGELRRQE